MTVRASELNWNAEKETQTSGMAKRRGNHIDKQTNKQTNKQIGVQINRQYTKSAKTNAQTAEGSTDRHNKNR